MHSWENCNLQCRIFRAKETFKTPLFPSKLKNPKESYEVVKKNSIQSEKRNFEYTRKGLGESINQDCMKAGGKYWQNKICRSGI